MKKLFSSLFIAVSTIFGLIALVGSLLFALNIISFAANIFTFIFFGVEIALIAVFCYICYIYSKYKKRQKELEKVEEIKKSREEQLLALYKSFGIPPQKKPDGTLKNFYELLGIEPEFDEYGERVPTIYELLQIVPKFDQDGNEIPTVIFIKNKALKATKKIPAELLHMNKKLTEEEKAQLDEAKKLNTIVKIATLAGNTRAANNASAKIKQIPARKQKVSSMNTTGSKAKNFEPPDLSGLFSAGVTKPKTNEKPIVQNNQHSTPTEIKPENLATPKISIPDGSKEIIRNSNSVQKIAVAETSYMDNNINGIIVSSVDTMISKTEFGVMIELDEIEQREGK